MNRIKNFEWFKYININDLNEKDIEYIDVLIDEFNTSKPPIKNKR